MTLPPPPSYRPQPRRRADSEPEESLTTQLFVGQPKPGADSSADPAGSASRGQSGSQAQAGATAAMPPVTGTPAAPPQPQTAPAGQPATEPADATGDSAESTKMLSLEELRELAAETRDDRLDGTQEQDIPRDHLPKATKADEAFAEQQAAPSVWPARQPSDAPPPPPQPPAVSPAASQTYGATASGYAASPPGYPAAQGHSPVQSCGAAPGYAPGHGAPSPGQHAGFGQPPGVPTGSFPQPPAQPPRKKGGLPVPAIIAIILAALIVAGSIGYIVWDVSTRSDDVQGETPPPPPADTAEPTSEASQEPTETSGEQVAEAFTTPSGNISCTISNERARCEISSFDYEPQAEKPDDCKVDPWGSVVVANADGAGFSCADPPPASGDSQELAYGQSVEAHGMRCTSEESGVECTHMESGKGFSIARAGVDFKN
ncbi:DUF6636 domain-containing protein [Brevibacterium otitidis]|uniref:DUF6636 domain-containing protein n=1 Tax=Brevibacterium otitidis TaxID=53364 RepID=A0ABV5X674_9MICO|nr:hypothetical protein GCM10023233_10230 [Brevibacterium otitidis]